MFMARAASPKFSNLEYTTADQAAWITINRPQVRNALDYATHDEIKAALDLAEDDNEVRVVVIRGAGKGFCAGHDLTEDLAEGRPSIYAYRRQMLRDKPVVMRFWDCAKPTVAQVHGFCIGKGLDIALACDFTIVSDDTHLGYPEIRFGISDFCLLLPWLLGPKMAKKLLLTGDEITAEEAKRIGLISEVVPAVELSGRVERLAKKLALIPTEMQQINKSGLNRAYEVRGMENAINWYMDLLTMETVCKCPELEEFERRTNRDGFKTALEWSRKRFEGLD
jgi:enoyl-CoA hydratase/carnithine racemase